MNIRQSVRIALHALGANKLRATLTMLGIIIGVGAVSALLAIGKGAQASILREIQGIGSDLIFVLPGSISSGTVFNSSIGSDALTMEDAEAITKQGNCPDCASVAPQYDHSGEVVYSNASVYTTISGTTPEYQKIRNYSLERGQFFTNQDLAVSARVAAIGADVAEELFGSEDPIGKIVRINRVPIRVIGVLDRKGAVAFGTRDRGVIMPLSTTLHLFRRESTASGGNTLVSMVNVSAVDTAHIDHAIEQITLLLRERHKIQNQQDDFSVTSMKDVLDLTLTVTRVLTVFLSAIAAISLLVGGIGIMNIMFVSVMERTREIGLRKAVGARRSDILGQFLAEAVILSLSGGIVGILFGSGLSSLVSLTGAFSAQLSLESILLAAGFSVAVGLFFGIYPAQRAARLNPIDALRYE